MTKKIDYSLMNSRQIQGFNTKGDTYFRFIDENESTGDVYIFFFTNFSEAENPNMLFGFQQRTSNGLTEKNTYFFNRVFIGDRTSFLDIPSFDFYIGFCFVEDILSGYILSKKRQLLFIG